MLKNLLCAALLCCSNCNAVECPDPSYTLVITLDPGETVMIKSADGKCGTYIDYRDTRINKEFVYKSHSDCDDQGYHLDYHFIVWIKCPGCNNYYNELDGGCKNYYCPSKMA
jgi:hypothetical protein